MNEKDIADIDTAPVESENQLNPIKRGMITISMVSRKVVAIFQAMNRALNHLLARPDQQSKT